MFLDKWIDDITEVTINYFGGKDKNAALYSNLLLYKLINSYVWESEFKNNKLYISNEDNTYSYIEIPKYYDPLDNNLEIRDKVKFNVLGHKYKNTRYYYDFFDIAEYDEKYKHLTNEDIDLMFWDKPDNSKGFYEYKNNDINNNIMLELIEKLKLKDNSSRPYYSIILEDDLMKQKQNKEDLFNEIEYVLYKKSNDIEKYTNMSDFYSGNTKEILGHRYYDGSDIHKFYIVAQNKIGPIGMICVFDHSDKGVLNEDDNRWSLSFISVSPTYRNKGIAKNLLRELIQYAIDNEKYVFRTDPSDIGKKYLFKTYSNIAKEEFPGFAFIPYRIGQSLSRVTHLDSFRNAEYKEKCQILNELSNKLIETASEDLFYFDENVVSEYINNDEKQNLLKI